MVNPLEEYFPGLAKGDYQLTSPKDPIYNCIAWAVGEMGKWWWPGPNPEEEYWPAGLPREVSLPAFRLALASIGYVECQDSGLEPGQEKVALFADSKGKPTHAARQLSNGRWTSKLGKLDDIEHNLHDLEGQVNGSVTLIMKRPIQKSE